MNRTPGTSPFRYPNDWNEASLAEVATIVTGRTPVTSDPGNFGRDVLFVTPGDIGKTKYLLNSERRLSFRGAAQSRTIPTNSVLFVCIGSTIGKLGLSTRTVSFNQQINGLVCKPGFSPEYLYYALSLVAPAVKQKASEQAVPLLNKRDFSKIKLYFPSFDEQCAISQCLSDVDTLIDALDKLIAKKRNIKHGAMQVLLTRKTRLPGFNGEWTTKRLGDVAAMSSGGTPPSKVKEYYGGNIKWASIADMTGSGKYLSRTEVNLSNAGLNNSAAVLYKAPIILYAMYASLGEVSICQEEVSSSQAILGIAPNEQIDLEFLYYLLVAYKPTVKSLGQQGTQSNLNKGMVQRFEFSVPSNKNEQRAIASVLADMDAEIDALVAQKEKTALIKTGMMQELLTGRTRLL